MTRLPKTKKLAQEQGSPKYFTGVPCNRGHISPRYVTGHCVECRRELANAKYGELKRLHPEELKEKNRVEAKKREKYRREYDRNRDKKALSDKDKKWYNKNAAKKKAYVKQYALENADKVNAKNALRRSDRELRTPAWLSEADKQEMECLYKKAKQRSIETGVPHEVDHIIPLRGKRVSGLHVPSNLRIITAKENRRKSNSFN